MHKLPLKLVIFITFLTAFSTCGPENGLSACLEIYTSEDDENLYHRITAVNPVHSGAQGKVYLLPDSESAYKVIDYSNMNQFIQALVIKNALAEFEALQKLVKHDCFLQMISCRHYLDAKMIVIETERVDKDLTTLDALPSDDNGLDVFLSLAVCVEALHHLGWAHNDLKPSNLAFKDDRLLLIDFGLASRLGKQVDGGTMGYLPKEFIEVVPDSDGEMTLRKNSRATRERDVYSLGVTFAVLYFGFERIFDSKDADQKLWKDESMYLYQEKVKKRITTLIYEELSHFSPCDRKTALARMIFEMLNDDSEKRPKLSKLIDFMQALSPDPALNLAPPEYESLIFEYWGKLEVLFSLPPQLHKPEEYAGLESSISGFEDGQMSHASNPSLLWEDDRIRI